MNLHLVALVFTVGMTTWAFRVLPTRMDLSRFKPGGVFNGFLASMGPAAISTLFVSALLPMLTAANANLVAIGAGLAGVIGFFAWRRSVIIATFGGAGVYALVLMLAQHST